MSNDKKIMAQGDVVFCPASLFPQEFLDRFHSKKKDNVLAWGETTFHSHRVTGDDFQILTQGEIKEAVSIMLIKAKERALIDHEEHEAFEIEGDYIVTIQQEVDHFEKTLKRVVD